MCRRCVHMCKYECMCMYVPVEARGQTHGALPDLPDLLCDRWSLIGTSGSPIIFSWLAIKPYEPSYLSLPSDRTPNAHHHAQPLFMFWSVEQTQGCMLEWKALFPLATSLAPRLITFLINRFRTNSRLDFHSSKQTLGKVLLERASTRLGIKSRGAGPDVGPNSPVRISPRGNSTPSPQPSQHEFAFPTPFSCP